MDCGTDQQVSTFLSVVKGVSWWESIDEVQFLAVLDLLLVLSILLG